MLEQTKNEANKNNILMNIRSKYILKLIIDHLDEFKSLKFVNHNKWLLNQLEMDINN